MISFFSKEFGLSHVSVLLVVAYPSYFTVTGMLAEFVPCPVVQDRAENCHDYFSLNSCIQEFITLRQF